jgi:opacity protein-like surface antigen
VTATINPSTTGIGPFSLTFSLPIVGNVTVGPFGPFSVPISGQVNVPGQNAPVTTTTDPGQTRTGTGTAAVPAQTITIPAQTVTVTTPVQTVTLPLPHPTTVTALVTRSVDVSSKVDQIADLRGKFGFANGFLGPNWLFYFTGGAAVGHFERTLTLTQTVSVVGDGTRTNTFQSSAGDTRLGWVIGAGFDWRMTPNVLLGVLYRHHEFPSSTISFVDDSGGSGRPVSFGTSRAHVDSVQGRLSWLFPIQ